MLLGARRLGLDALDGRLDGGRDLGLDFSRRGVQRLILRQAALLVFAGGAAEAGLVTPRPCCLWSDHRSSVPDPPRAGGKRLGLRHLQCRVSPFQL